MRGGARESCMGCGGLVELGFYSQTMEESRL